MKFVTSIIIDLLFPAKCIICNNYSSNSHLCSKCWGNLNFISKPSCAICSYPFLYETDENAICGHCIINKPIYNKAISVFSYDNYSKDLIHKFKYQDQLHILSYLVNLMINAGKELIEQADIIIPVPMHKYKLLKRGYNQSALIAMQIASKKNLL